ncbi:hypothetical protein GEMRC1_010943 [Eukaryota sp. GEM-RC1]
MTSSDKNCPVIFSHVDSHYFAKCLSAQLGLPCQMVETRPFSNGETYYRIPVDQAMELIGRDVILVCSTHSDEALLFFLRVGIQLASMGTRRRIFVCPFLGYSTMERSRFPGEVVTAKSNAILFSSIPSLASGNTFLFIDLHNQCLQHFLQSCCALELYAESVLRKAICSLNLDPDSFVMGSADLGRPLWLKSYANTFNVKMAFIDKSRNFESIQVEHILGEVEGKSVVIFDDMIRSGSTAFSAADAYLSQGAVAVYLVVTHFAISKEEVVDLIEASSFAKVIGTDSHPMSQLQQVKDSKKIEIVSVCEVFSEAVTQLLV